MGSVGLIFRFHEPEVGIEVWGITPESEGYFIFALTQSQILAQPAQGLVMSSPDGRAAARVIGSECIRRDADGSNPRVTSAECIGGLLTNPAGAPIGSERYALISLGPNFEGKVHNIILNDGVLGDVIGTVDTFTGLPGIIAAPIVESVQAVTPEPTPTAIAYARPVQPQAARADGSLIHVVQPGDTVWSIAVAYGVKPWDIVDRNQLYNFGRLLRIGRELVIRDPS